MISFFDLTDDPTEALMQDWVEAELDAIAAYDAWARDGDRDSYVVYRAYADQADAAQDALAAASRRELRQAPAPLPALAA